MATLHLVHESGALADCLARAGAHDVILLLEDGVYAAVRAQAPDRELRALEPDVRARGLGNRLGRHVRPVTDEEFVALAVAHQPIVSWR